MAEEFASEARRRAKGLIDRAGNIAGEQAIHQLHWLSEGLRSAGSGLVTVADRSQQAGVMPDAARRVSQFTHRSADWLDSQGPRTLVASFRGQARRSPAMFLSAAVAAGFVLGQLTRALSSRNRASCEEEKP
jgi:hypothetical protein